MKAFAAGAALGVENDCAHHRIGRGAVTPPVGQFEGAAHPSLVGGGGGVVSIRGGKAGERTGVVAGRSPGFSSVSFPMVKV
jgi:hypothetical protein